MELTGIEIIFGIAANGIRFYANKRYIDFFMPKDTCRWKSMWWLYSIASIGTFYISAAFANPAWTLLANVLALLLLVLPYQVSFLKKIWVVFIVYIINAIVDIVVVQVMTRYVPGQPVEQIYSGIIDLILLLSTVFLRNPSDEEKETELPAYHMMALILLPVISIVCIHVTIALSNYQREISLIIALGFLVTNVLVFSIYCSLQKFHSASMNEKRLEQMNHIYRYQLKVMQESNDQIEKLRHDLKHHILELSAMAKNDSCTDIEQYLSRMEKFMLNPDEKVQTGNEELDGVLNYLLRKANETLKKVETDIKIPERMYSRNFDVCAVMGNLVENAIREAEKSEEKYLSVAMHMQMNALLIHIVNSYSGKIREENNRFITTQKKSGIHGSGLESVKKIVAENKGGIKFEYTENRFCVQVMLYLTEGQK